MDIDNNGVKAGEGSGGVEGGKGEKMGPSVIMSTTTKKCTKYMWIHWYKINVINLGMCNEVYRTWKNSLAYGLYLWVLNYACPYLCQGCKGKNLVGMK